MKPTTFRNKVSDFASWKIRRNGFSSFSFSSSVSRNGFQDERLDCSLYRTSLVHATRLMLRNLRGIIAKHLVYEDRAKQPTVLFVPPTQTFFHLNSVKKRGNCDRVFGRRKLLMVLLSANGISSSSFNVNSFVKKAAKTVDEIWLSCLDNRFFYLYCFNFRNGTCFASNWLVC